MACTSGYRGEWKVNEATQKVSGNPAKAPIVIDFLKSVKNMYGLDGGCRTHSVAMSEGHMKAIYNYLSQNDLSNKPAGHVQTLHERGLCTRALFFLAFSTFSWTIWTR
jgi:hypothetical protein